MTPLLHDQTFTRYDQLSSVIQGSVEGRQKKIRITNALSLAKHTRIAAVNKPNGLKFE
jgi:hypothetical protein